MNSTAFKINLNKYYSDRYRELSDQLSSERIKSKEKDKMVSMKAAKKIALLECSLINHEHMRINDDTFLQASILSDASALIDQETESFRNSLGELK